MDNRNEQPKMDTQSSYDAVASDYRQKFLHELEHKPFDCARLDEFAAQLKDKRVWDIGCGPGQVTRYLHEQGVQATGVDLSPEMIAQANKPMRIDPTLNFWCGTCAICKLRMGHWRGLSRFMRLSIFHART
jgi:2-polyprenyl-3-methyl-5-hydroxy-6-metoxy-1,4-benzoquinol methylase